jgi:hypothetical protein
MSNPPGHHVYQRADSGTSMSNLPEHSTHYVYGAEPTVTSQAPNGWTCPYLEVPKSCVHTGLLPFWTTPMPMLRN